MQAEHEDVVIQVPDQVMDVAAPTANEPASDEDYEHEPKDIDYDNITFNNLPEDLLFEITKFMDVHTLTIISLVSHQWFHAARKILTGTVKQSRYKKNFTKLKCTYTIIR
jgi:hypothetical protein